MLKNFIFLSLTSIFFILISCGDDNTIAPPDTKMQVSVKVGTENLTTGQTVDAIPIDEPVVARFSHELDTSDMVDHFILQESVSRDAVDLTFFFLDNNKTVSARPVADLKTNTLYTVSLSNQFRGAGGETFDGAVFEFLTLQIPLTLEEIRVNDISLNQSGRITDIPLDFQITAKFSHDVDLIDFQDNIRLKSPFQIYTLQVEKAPNSEREFIITPISQPDYISRHTLEIYDDLESAQGNPFAGFSKQFYTQLDSTPKFPAISDEELLTKVQEQTFKYFWDFGHPVSGLNRERNTSNHTVTSGGSGFGLMAIIVGIERDFITREEGVERFDKIITFLGDKADRFHGAWSHWLSGETGKVIPFSSNDDGGDLVETSYMAMGLLTVRQYLDDQTSEEKTIIDKINALWEAIEWDWYTQGDQDYLYWHWSPNFAWEKNHRIRGWNEALITYIMAASSPTHPIDADVYHNGWARNGDMVNGNAYYGITLPLGSTLGGPLFFEHYTYLGIDPRNLEDQYADYWQQCVNHTLINREHCILNPSRYVGYSEACWGLTASDGNSGYSAHSPTNDRGVITPTAAISSIPYTPEESVDAIRHFYYILGDKLWKEYGFVDAFNLTENWFASSFLAIDQGPIIIMIENHRTGLLWDLFMSCPEVQQGLTKLGFTY